MPIDIRTPYTTQPHMMRHDGPVFNSNPNIKIIDSKHRELEIWRDDLYGFIDSDTTRDLIKQACAVTGISVTDDIVQFALFFEEDVAIMHRGVLQAICFCFPSNWIPKTRVGYSLTDIHSHVADGEKLTSASQRIAETMAGENCYKRHVWTISTSSDLNQHPLKNVDRPKPTSIDELYFRVETQTTKPLGDGVSSLFFVKVDVYSLSDIFNNKIHKKSIIDSVNSMTDAVLQYKNLMDIKSLLNS